MFWRRKKKKKKAPPYVEPWTPEERRYQTWKRATKVLEDAIVDGVDDYTREKYEDSIAALRMSMRLYLER